MRHLLPFLTLFVIGCGVPAPFAAPSIPENDVSPPPPSPQPPPDLNTYDGVVADIVSKLDEPSKDKLRTTAKDDLIQFHHGWGTGIRNEYGFWSNEALVASCGKKRGRVGSSTPTTLP